MVHGEARRRVREFFTQKTGGLIVPYTVGRFLTLDGKRTVSIGRSGVADDIACLDGRYIAIETKASDSDAQKKDQKKYQALVEKNGGLYIIADFRRGRDGLSAIEVALQC